MPVYESDTGDPAAALEAAPLSQAPAIAADSVQAALLQNLWAPWPNFPEKGPASWTRFWIVTIFVLIRIFRQALWSLFVSLVGSFSFCSFL